MKTFLERLITLIQQEMARKRNTQGNALVLILRKIQGTLYVDPLRISEIAVSDYVGPI